MACNPNKRRRLQGPEESCSGDGNKPTDIRLITKDWGFNVLLKEISKNTKPGELDEMKFLCRGDDDGIGKRELEKIKTPLQLFDALRNRLLLDANNLIHLQGLVWQTKNQDNLNKLVEFARESSKRPLHFFVPQEPPNGFTRVTFHVDGPRVERKQIDNIRYTVAEIVRTKPEYVVWIGATPFDSILLAFMIPTRAVDILLTITPEERGYLSKLDISKFTVNDKQLFVKGKKSDDPLDVDYVPSLHLGYEHKSPGPKDTDRYNRRKKRENDMNERENRTLAASVLLELGNHDSAGRTSEVCDALDTNASVHDVCIKTIAELRKNNERMLQELERLQRENVDLKSENNKLKFGVNVIKDNNSRTTSLTGLPSYATFVWLLSYLSCVLPEKEILSKENILLLVLMKLRLNLLNWDLAIRFHVSESVISDIINKILPEIANKLKFLIHWPSKEDTIRNTPKIVKDHFKGCRCIIDCTEIFIDRPGNLTARASTWSNYKHNNTVKLLVAINPCGSISFASKAFGGRTSDKVITQRSGFLNLIEYGDVVLADRGFLISDELTSRSATLASPAFTRCQTQLSQKDIEKTRYLARVRIHVERAIGRLKTYKCISGVLPMNLVPHVDSIVIICAALCNLHPSLIV